MQEKKALQCRIESYRQSVIRRSSTLRRYSLIGLLGTLAIFIVTLQLHFPGIQYARGILLALLPVLSIPGMAPNESLVGGNRWLRENGARLSKLLDQAQGQCEDQSTRLSVDALESVEWSELYALLAARFSDIDNFTRTRLSRKQRQVLINSVTQAYRAADNTPLDFVVNVIRCLSYEGGQSEFEQVERLISLPTSGVFPERFNDATKSALIHWRTRLDDANAKSNLVRSAERGPDELLQPAEQRPSDSDAASSLLRGGPDC
jgi:hypothetical protein